MSEVSSSSSTLTWPVRSKSSLAEVTRILWRMSTPRERSLRSAFLDCFGGKLGRQREEPVMRMIFFGGCGRAADGPVAGVVEVGG